MQITFNEFCEVMQDLAFVREQEENPPYIFSNPTMEQHVVDLLQKICNDKNHWISYFIYELHFGTKWKPDIVIDLNKENVKLDCIAALWNLLMEQNNEQW